LSFCVAVFLFNEPFDQVKLLAFGCIWVALAIYTIDMVRTSRRQHALTPLPVE
jgi:chloramphenicol-sensitive protein RarD